MGETAKLPEPALVAVSINVGVKGDKEYKKAVFRTQPRNNRSITGAGVRAVALKTQSISTRTKIHPGGSSKPLSHAITSRTGTGRRSVRVNFSLNAGWAEVGSDLRYMAVHESGGTFTIKSHTVAKHTRTVAFGKKFAPFTVPAYKVKSHKAKFPKRAWLEPAVDEVLPRAPGICVNIWAQKSKVPQ